MNLLDENISELKIKMESNGISSEEIVKKHMEKIKKNDLAPEIYSYIDEEGAINKAKEIDEKRKDGEKLGRLAGIPVGISDEISTKGVLTSAGSKMLENYKPPFNASVMDNLLKEDALMVGKIAIDEFRTSYSDSSSKSVKSGDTAFTLGSDAGGSLRIAASRDGLFAIKPTYGLVSRYGVISGTSTLDGLGATTKSIEDLAMVLNTIVGYDKRDSASISRDKIDYESVLGEDISGMKIGLPKELFGEDLDPEIEKTLLKAVEKLKSLGVIVEEVSIPNLKYSSEVYEVISSGEFSSNLARFDGIGYGYRTKEYEDLEDLYKNSRSEAFGDKVKEKILFGNFVLNSAQYDRYYIKAQKVRTMIKKDFTSAFKTYDLILSPISKTDDNTFENYTLAANIAGLPAMTLPLASNDKNIGFQLMAGAFNDEALLRLAYAYEMNKDKAGVNDSE